jgi:hypothetical protein
VLYLLIIICFIVLYFNKNARQYGAWLCVYLITDPGGIVGSYMSKGSMGGAFFIDILFIATFIFLFLGNYKIREFFNNKIARSIFYILFIFILYKILVWGLIIPGRSFDEFFRYCIIRERDSIYGFLFIIPAYLFALRDLTNFFKIIVFASPIIILLILLSILIPSLDIINVSSFERYTGSGIMRHLTHGYSLLNFLIPVSVYIFINNINVKYRRLILFGGILASLNILISLTKGMYLNMFAYLLSAMFFSIKFLNVKINKLIWRSIGFFLIFIFILNLTFPNYSNYALRSIEDMVLIINEGRTSHGEGVGRLNQIPVILQEIYKSPFFGVGYLADHLVTRSDWDLYDATDLSILAHIMQYGFIGIFIYLIYYLRVYNLIKSIFRKYKLMDKYEIIHKYKYETIFVVASLAYFIAYFMKFYAIFIELTNGRMRIELCIFTGILLACLERINRVSQTEKLTQD